MNGPYETEADALAGPLRQEIHGMHESGRYGINELSQAVRAAQLRHIEDACRDAGVELGAFDWQILEWLAGYEASTVQVIIGLIARAAAGEGGCE
jgi:hypothetical protein